MWCSGRYVREWANRIHRALLVVVAVSQAVAVIYLVILGFLALISTTGCSLVERMFSFFPRAVEICNRIAPRELQSGALPFLAL